MMFHPVDPGELASAAADVGVNRELARALLEVDFKQTAGDTDVPSLAAKLKKLVAAKVEAAGMTAAEAALSLGLTEPSFADMVRRNVGVRTYQNSDGKPRFLEDDLDALIDAYTPRFKTWASRSNLLREFHRNLSAKLGPSEDFVPREQACEGGAAEGGCRNLASVICSNPDCRPGAAPRKVCPRHQEHLATALDERLCDECVRRVVAGELTGFDLAGSPDRLEKDYSPSPASA